MDNPSHLPPPDANPGKGISGTCAFSNDEGSWVEEFDLLQLLAEVLSAGEMKVRKHDDTLNVEGILLRPGIVDIQPLENGYVRTATTIEYSFHQRHVQGVFEFQHATGNDLNQALRSGFENWVDTDLTVMIEALARTTSSLHKIAFQNQDGLKKVAYLGNPLRMAVRTDKDDHDHPFCPCCMFTNSLPAFESCIKNPGFYALRLFSSRDTTGNISADCRINGTDHEPGKPLLEEYARSWPDQGFELRKQYVIVMDEIDPTASKPSFLEGGTEAGASMPSLKLRIPPMLLVALFALAMFGLSRITPQVALPGSLRNFLLALAFAPGLVCAVCGVIEFRRRKTTVDPRYPDKASSLVCSGIYRLTRNPMYLGFLFILTGIGIALQSPAALILLPVFVAYMNAFQIRPEEELLRAKFGTP